MAPKLQLKQLFKTTSVQLTFSWTFLETDDIIASKYTVPISSPALARKSYSQEEKKKAQVGEGRDDFWFRTVTPGLGSGTPGT